MTAKPGGPARSADSPAQRAAADCRAAKPVRRGLGIAALILVLDQATKWVVLHQVMSPPQIIKIAPFFNLAYVWNRGISFGMFNTDSPWNRWTLPAVALAIVAFLIHWLRRTQHRLVITALGLIIGGAIGNVLDRAIYGAVFDFLDVHAYGYHWPAFNVADSAITIGVCLLIVDSLFGISARQQQDASRVNKGRSE